MTISGNEAWNRNVFRCWWKVDRDEAEITLSGRLFEMVGPVSGKVQRQRRAMSALEMWSSFLYNWPSVYNYSELSRVISTGTEWFRDSRIPPSTSSLSQDHRKQNSIVGKTWPVYTQQHLSNSPELHHCYLPVFHVSVVRINVLLLQQQTISCYLLMTHTHLTALCSGQWVAVESAGPYASLHLAPNR